MNKSVITMLAMTLVSGCGYSSLNNEVIGQAKKTVNQNPIICDTRVDADISLGVMQNGVGSMSSEDAWFTVPDDRNQTILKEAVEHGSLVKITYDVKRITFCWRNHIVRKVEIINTKPVEKK